MTPPPSRGAEPSTGGIVIHAPPSTASSSAGSRSKLPSAVTVPSLAYTANVAGRSLKFVTATRSDFSSPPATTCRSDTRPSGPFAVDGCSAHVVPVVDAEGSGELVRRRHRPCHGETRTHDSQTHHRQRNTRSKRTTILTSTSVAGQHTLTGHTRWSVPDQSTGNRVTVSMPV